MTVGKHWFRLCVDISSRAEIKGASYEVRDPNGDMITYGTVGFGPFDDEHDVLVAIHEAIVDRFGTYSELSDR
jgi:hypothetical protein